LRIALGADHGGFPGKAAIAGFLRRNGHRVVDVGTFSDESVDYPVFARLVAEKVARGACRRGILLCGTGIGMAIAANKVKGIRAAVVWDPTTARLAAEHNGANVLCLSGRLFNDRQRLAMVKAWLATPFGGGRHARRLRAISKLEKAAYHPLLSR
jgi:ribose 5-phosphate isomerase B